MAGIVFFSNSDVLADAEPKDRNIALLIMIIFAPVLALNNVIEDILDIILGIDNDDDDKRGGFF
jgi:hypothetical protein